MRMAESTSEQQANRGWIEVHQRLCDVAKRRGALDAEEAELLCIAARDEIWRQMGRASLLEYLKKCSATALARRGSACASRSSWRRCPN